MRHCPAPVVRGEDTGRGWEVCLAHGLFDDPSAAAAGRSHRPLGAGATPCFAAMCCEAGGAASVSCLDAQGLGQALTQRTHDAIEAYALTSRRGVRERPGTYHEVLATRLPLTTYGLCLAIRTVAGERHCMPSRQKMSLTKQRALPYARDRNCI